MKIKTSVTLSEDVLKRLDRAVGPGGNRSAVMEKALYAYLDGRERRRRDARDLELLDRLSHELNEEAADVLDYQVEP
jgi:metal-responsive CopG/Arc/MetJ family transcriptional regulator